MARFLMIFISVIVAAECFSFIKRQGEEQPVTDENRQAVCQSRNAECVAENLEGLDADEFARDVDRACTRIADYETCATPLIEVCQTPQYIIDYYTAAINFLCGSRGRSLVRQYKQSSPCYNNPSRVNTLRDGIHLCMAQNTIQPIPAEVKRTVTNVESEQLTPLYECIVNVVNSTCGPVAGQLVTEFAAALAEVENQHGVGDFLSYGTKRELGSWFI